MFVSLKLINSHPETKILVIEPWGDELSLEPGTTYTLTLTNIGQENPEIELIDGAVVVWAAYGSLVNVVQGDNLLLEEKAHFPKPPLGKSTREFLQSVFGE